MRIKAIAFIPFSLVIALSITGCGNSEKKDDTKNPTTVNSNPSAKNSPAISKVDQIDLTGVWTRADGALFDCIDSGELLILKRRLTEKDEALKSFEVELARKGKTLDGKARFFFVDEAEEYSLGWKLTENGDYEYKGKLESYQVDESGKEVRKDLDSIFKIKPKYPPKPKAAPKPKVAPKPKITKPAGKALVIKDTPAKERDVKSLLRHVFSDDAKKVTAASVKVLVLGRPADTQLENACFDQEDAGKRMRLAMILSFRKNSVGLESLLELSVDSNLEIATGVLVERYLNVSLCALFNADGADLSEANLTKVLENPSKGAEATALAAIGKAFKPELTATTWLKSDDLASRKISQAMLFPGGQALSGAYGEYSGAVYVAEDEKAQRDSAADEFLKWFEAGPKAKIEKK
jgi:hypothetical protein